MAKYYRTPNYREMYPEASEEVIQCLRAGYRKMQYAEYDLKVERFKLDPKTQRVTIIPAREDSLDRRVEEGQQFQYQEEPVDELITKKLMIAKMMECVAALTTEEQALIAALFFCGKSEREWSTETGIPQKTINNRRLQLMKKLKKMMEK
ncbi:MAG: sigma-70 family RNA polymerase sigma factor [Oscillospiraceae bacterium]|nr:sigma-70 family RNA polymerase sigma factor [Oscillospiraceae bacterium]